MANQLRDCTVKRITWKSLRRSGSSATRRSIASPLRLRTGAPFSESQLIQYNITSTYTIVMMAFLVSTVLGICELLRGESPTAL
jgi:hypothetical protein